MLAITMTLILMAGWQEPSTDTEPSRAETLQQAREEKAVNLQKPTRTFLERGLQEFRDQRVMERFYEGFHGFHPIIGGIRSGSGFGGGTYVEGKGIRASAQASINGYQKYEVRYTAPVPGKLLFADFRATYRDLAQERYFGSGPNSRKEDETNFRQEDINYVGRFGVKPAKHVRAGVIAGYLKTNVGSGTNPVSPSIEKRFATAEAPALENQPNYFQTGLFFEADYRDEPGNPRSGGLYSASWTSFNDRKLGLYGFGQYDLEAQQYLPFFNKRRVIALRAKSTLTNTASGQEIPFYMQPTLGGSEDLRGYSEYRFRGRNVVVVNAEYRFEAFSGLDLAVFGDAGQVAERPRDLRFSEFKTAYGVGFRFNTAKSVFLRVDLGFSNEGQRLFVKFGHVF
jgi:outer membrane protein assembly factor BamA